LFGPLGLQKPDGVGGGTIVSPVRRALLVAVDQKCGVGVCALSPETDEPVEAGANGLIVHVPFADVAGRVTSRAQNRCVRVKGLTERRLVVEHAVDMAVPAAQETSPARRAERI